MSSDADTLSLIIQEFPGLKEEISELFTESLSFQELCEDYVYCRQNIVSLASDKSPASRKETRELKKVLGELKDELMDRLV